MMEDLTSGTGYWLSRFGYVKVSRAWRRLTLLEDLGIHPGRRGGRRTHWVRCICDCGARVDVQVPHLRQGSTRSCGCLHRDISRALHLTHGQSYTRLYVIWGMMRSRCTNPNNPRYSSNGGHGITIDPQWDDFQEFRAWATSHGYTDHLSIDRIDNSLGYSPENCRWATATEQARNSRRNRMVTAFRETKTLIEWSEDQRCHVRYDTLLRRLRRGWMPELAISRELQR
jgi:hypothetical protein